MEVLESKYEVCRGLLREDTQSHSSLWWRDLKLVCDEGSPNKWFDRRLMWKICIGNQARFWLVNWVGMNWWKNSFDYSIFPIKKISSLRGWVIGEKVF